MLLHFHSIEQSHIVTVMFGMHEIEDLGLQLPDLVSDCNGSDIGATNRSIWASTGLVPQWYMKTPGVLAG